MNQRHTLGHRKTDPGARGTVSLEGMAMPVPFVVRSVDDRGALHVEFEIDATVAQALAALLDRLPQRRAA